MKKKVFWSIVTLLILCITILGYKFVMKEKGYMRIYINNKDYLYLSKNYNDVFFTNSELEILSNKYNISFINGKNIYVNDKVLDETFLNIDISKKDNKPYTYNLNLKLDFKTEVISEQIIGRMAQSKNEIVISNYLADLFIYYNSLNIKREELLETKSNITFNNSNYKIVGIINYEIPFYNEIIKYNNIDSIIKGKYLEFEKYKEKYLYNVFVTDDFFDNFKNNTNHQPKLINVDFKINHNQTIDKITAGNNISYYDGLEYVNSNLKENEIVLNIHSLYLAKYGKFYDHGIDKNLSQKENFEKTVSALNIIGTNIMIKIKDNRTLSEVKKSVKIVGITEENNYFSNNLISSYIPNTIENGNAYFTIKNYQHLKKLMNSIENNNNLRLPTYLFE